MSRPLPLRANLEWLRKRGKDRLAELRASRPAATLSEAQRLIAQDYGFQSWRKLKAHVQHQREKLDALVPPENLRQAATDVVAPDDPDLKHLFAAVAAGEADIVAGLLGQRPALTSAHGPEGQAALHLAAQYNDPRLAAVLVAYGASLEAKFGRSGHSPLSWAVTCNAMECARVLVRLGTTPDLFCAAGMGDVERVQAFFDAAGKLFPNPSRTGASRFTTDGSRLPCPPTDPNDVVADALAIACRNAHVAVVRYLLDKRPNLGFRAYLGATPLHWAYFGGSSAIVELLEAAGADPLVRDDTFECTPRAFGICAPANWGLAFLVRARLAQDPTLATIRDGRTSPLHEAARCGRLEIIKILLDHGADPTARNGDGQTPIELANSNGQPAAAALLAGLHS